MPNENIIYYSKNATNKRILDDYDMEFREENRTCGDDLKVYIKFDWDKIADWSFTWDTAIITTACASLFWETAIGKSFDEILQMDYDSIENLIWEKLTTRRKKAWVLGVLTTRNAIHKYLNDGKKDTFDDLIK